MHSIKLTKSQELELYYGRIQDKYGLTVWQTPILQLRKNSKNSTNTHPMYCNVECPVCTDKPKFESETKLKNHIEHAHFDQVAHKPFTVKGKKQLEQLILDAKLEESSRKQNNDVNKLIEHFHNTEEEVDNYDSNCNNFGYDDSTDDESVIFEDQEEEIMYDNATSTNQPPKAIRTKVLDRVMNCTILMRIMFILEMVEYDISEAKKGEVANQIMNIANEVSELFSGTFLNASQTLNKYKYLGDEDNVRQVLSTSYMRREYRLRDLKDYFIEPKIYDLDYEDKDGKEQKAERYSYVSFKSLAQKYIKNSSIRAKLEAEKLDKSPTTSELEARTRGKLKIELNTDDAQLSPGNGMGTGKNQKYLHMYATFADLPFVNRIKMVDIELVLMIKRMDLNKIQIGKRIEFLLKRVKKDLFDLFENGIEFEGKRYDVTISVITGDNLGMYELLGFNYTFKNDSFVCRFCGAMGKCKLHVKRKEPESEQPKCDPQCHTIQNKTSNLKLLTIEDFSDPLKQKEYGFRYIYPFDGLPDISLVNISPPDLMHDLPEGVLPKIVEMLLLKIRTTIKQDKTIKILLPEVTQILCKKFETFTFYEGNPKVHWGSSFKIDGKAVQKLEAFLKLEAILEDIDFKNGKKMNLKDLLEGSEGYEFYLSCKKFTLLAFSAKLNEEELIDMRALASKIVVQCKELSDSDVYCKLHHLLHYADLVKVFGPLRKFAIFHYEQKHQQSKYIARRMKNFVNASKTIAERQQFKRAAVEKRMNFYEFDFKEVPINTNQLIRINPKDIKLNKLSWVDRPFRINKNVIRKINGCDKQWFHVEDFHEGANDGKIYCSGKTLEMNHNGTDLTGNMIQLHEKSHLESELICYSNLHHSNDFYHKDSNGKFWLMKWI